MHCRIIEGAEPGIDALWTEADAVHCPEQHIDRHLRKLGGMLLAGKTLFFVVADDFRAGLACHLYQRNSGIVRSCSNTGQVDGLAAVKFGA